MRVLRLSSVFEAPASSLAARATRFDPIGGMQTHTGGLTRELDRLGVAQSVVTAYRPGSPRRDLVGDAAVVYRVGLPVARPRQLYAPPALLLAGRLAWTADLVHAHQGEDVAILPIAVAAARLRRLPLVVTVHTSLRHTLPVHDARTAALKLVGSPLESWALRSAEAVIALTPRLRRLTGHETIEVVPSGVEAGLFTGPHDDPFPDFPRPRVLFLGRLARQKDVRTFLRSVALLEPLRAHALVVGDGPGRAGLESEARRLGLDGRVRFAGFVPHDRVPAVLAHADVLALPSAYEELGSVLLEAMWAGVPVVAARTGGVPDAVADGATGLLVPPRDPRALADALARVLADRRLAGALAR
ncbi:MAG: glycosyltransferase, partial [Actinomycetota bacterium]|nr:glycosyltransferase [Actinomycetota bacterium]